MFTTLLSYFVQWMLAALVAGFVTGLVYQTRRYMTRTVPVPAAATELTTTPEWVFYVYCGVWGAACGAFAALYQLGTSSIPTN